MALTEFSSTEVVSRANVNQRINAVNNMFPVTVSNGGTGNNILTNGNILVGAGTNAISTISKVPISKGGTNGTTATEARTNLSVYTAESLYSNSSGNTGTVTLSSSASNYAFIEIYSYNSTCSRVWSPNGKTVNITFNNGNYDALEWWAKKVTISGTTITVSSNVSGYVYNGGNPVIYSGSTQKSTPIFKVIGYKH